MVRGDWAVCAAIVNTKDTKDTKVRLIIFIFLLLKVAEFPPWRTTVEFSFVPSVSFVLKTRRVVSHRASVTVNCASRAAGGVCPRRDFASTFSTYRPGARSFNGMSVV